MIVGAHSILYSLSPPAEVAVHPSTKNDIHELYLMCDDVEAFVKAMGKRNITCTPPQDQGWGVLTQVRLPGGGKLGVYQPRHARPKAMSVGRKKAARKTTKKQAKRRVRGR